MFLTMVTLCIQTRYRNVKKNKYYCSLKEACKTIDPINQFNPLSPLYGYHIIYGISLIEI